MVEGLTKNEKARIIKMTDTAFDIMKKIREYHGVDEEDENEFIVKTRTGKPNTTTNLEHRMATIYKNIGLEELKGELHIFRRTFATRMYENGARVKEIAAYIMIWNLRRNVTILLCGKRLLKMEKLNR